MRAPAKSVKTMGLLNLALLFYSLFSTIYSFFYYYFFSSCFTTSFIFKSVSNYFYSCFLPYLPSTLDLSIITEINIGS